MLVSFTGQLYSLRKTQRELFNKQNDLIDSDANNQTGVVGGRIIKTFCIRKKQNYL